MSSAETIQIFTILQFAIPVLFAITLHEAAHGFVAYKFGDKTAFMLGRLTLNPFKHIDPIGTILVPSILYMTSGFIFGWAKPIPVVSRNLKNPKIDMAVVAAAGPISNLIMALGWTIILAITHNYMPESSFHSGFLFEMSLIGITINVILAVFNMLPIPPLDGSRVIDPFLPRTVSRLYYEIEPYGLFIIFALLFSGVLHNIIQPFFWGLTSIFLQLAGV